MNVLEKILEEIKDNTKLGNLHWETISIEKVEEIIRSHMDETPNNEWIPTSERLPNEEEFQKAYIGVACAAGFIVMIKNATIPTMAYYLRNSQNWVDEEGNCYNVVAWQPLPEPYKGE